MKKFLFLACLIIPFYASAEPVIKGTPSELSAYLNEVSKIVTVSATAEKKVASTKAIVKLLIETEAKALASALSVNSKIRADVRKKLIAKGIKASNIRESKFSSTPEYGFFGDEPNSYTVSNVLSVVVTSDSQMIAVADISDKGENVRYLSSKAEIGDRSKIKAELLKLALKIAKEKATVYQKSLGVKLKPVAFNEASIHLIETRPIKMARKSKLVSYASNSASTTSFGETSFTLSIHINYLLVPN
ncbi:MAG: SIMPL domain-containing protein [Gammaproteobacteria bacterium]|nr:SIMPL domain-containing protein [Gammaproteobacteria bacterium]